MKIKKLICISVVSVFLIGLAGCTNKDSKPDNTKQSNNNQTQSQSNVNPPSQNTTSNNDTGDNKPITLQQTSNVSPKTHEDVLAKIRTALKTRVPIMLPTNVSVSNGNYLTAVTTSKTYDYKVDFYESNQAVDINSQAASKGNFILAVEGTEYKDAASAKGSINGYAQVDPSKYPNMAIDLGHRIKALQEGAAGHGYIKWNEGRWYIVVDSPNDPANVNKKYPDGNQLAKNIVKYLDTNMLPAPQSIGVIKVDNWNNSNGTNIVLQRNQVVYQISSKDPMMALEAAVAMK